VSDHPGDGDLALGTAIALLDQAGKEADAVAEYTRDAQRRLLEGQLLGIVRNMDRIVAKLEADRATIDAQHARLAAVHAAVQTVDHESVPQTIIADLTPVLEGIGHGLEALRSLDTELADTQRLTGEVLKGGAPQHIQARTQRVRDRTDDALRALDLAKAAIGDMVRRASRAGQIGTPEAAGTAAPVTNSNDDATYEQPTDIGSGDAGLSALMGDAPARAAEIVTWATAQGWTRQQSPNGPPKFVDANGIVRVTIKKGSARTPGSETPHVELRDTTGRRVDPYGKPVTRHSTANHTPIVWDLP